MHQPISGQHLGSFARLNGVIAVSLAQEEEAMDGFLWKIYAVDACHLVAEERPYNRTIVLCCETA
jgi:hypothetical protein